MKIATRKSPLAIWQAEYVQNALQEAHTGLQVELLGLSTQGDKILDTPLAKIGGKGLFIKELEYALLDGRADLAAHSMKDVPADTEFPDGLILGTICERENPFDAFVSNNYDSIDDLPEGAKVGTCSLRRRAQLLNYRPDLTILDLRGNVNTRLAKLDNGDFDAIILACAGLMRLEMNVRIRQEIPSDIMLPAVGQGAVGLEIRADDADTKNYVNALNDADTWTRVIAERAMNKRLQGGCQVPIGGFAELEGDQLRLRGFVGQPDGSQVLRAKHSGSRDDAEAIGTAVAEDLLSQGADKILDSLD